ncbi:leucyl aminopeptidase [Schauerella aestuarii]|uniref:leucyl aminopeptidase n=1 Tax=Schauerella aestuarii TaxID=2511204 RepID=UPI00136F8937|nr:leucyl aminopeptidase [Achromobacter aestuarii]MYZ43169.1 leucyl aminopeptidase [Achromobacter aestuarii]
MEFSTQTTASLHQLKTAALGVGIFADGVLSPAADQIDRASDGAVRAVVKSEFRATVGESLVLRNLPGVAAQRVVLIGLGKQEEYKATALASGERAFIAACVKANVTEAASSLASLAMQDVPVRARARSAAIAAGDATYRYDATFGKPDKDKRPKLKKVVHVVAAGDAADAKTGLQEGRAIAEGMNLTKLLGNLPPNICTPTYLGETAKRLAAEFKTLKVEVLERKQIEALGMGSFLSVARGSEEAPRFIVLRHPGSAAKKLAAKPAGKTSGGDGPVVLVGKGITFDSGGISIKPAATMDEMKYDMCGAASVLGTFRALAELDLPFEVVGLIASCENMPSGKALKPGDVVTSMAGHTIEVLNTDAEGRLVLCDALTYAERFKPAAVIDIATLTGACVVALGHVNTGLFTQDDDLADSLLKAGRASLDTAWRMPLEDAYQEQLKSNFADIANIGGPPGGSVTAACFLSRFTKAYRWAHLDIAGTAWKGGKEKGATGRPVPLLVQYLLDRQASRA